jgi:hypothetical protein
MMPEQYSWRFMILISLVDILVSRGLFGLSRAGLVAQRAWDATYFAHEAYSASLVTEADVQSASAPVSSPDITTSIDFDAEVPVQSAGEVV